MKYRLNWTMITIHTFGAVLSGTAFLLCVAGCENNAITGTYTSVSYTHLTLPTIA